MSIPPESASESSAGSQGVTDVHNQAHAGELEVALLELLGASNPWEPARQKLARARALAVLDLVGAARCAAGERGHPAGFHGAE